MDGSICRVIYVNRKVDNDRLVHVGSNDEPEQFQWASDSLRNELLLLVEAFREVHVCSSGATCLSALFDTPGDFGNQPLPIVVLIDTPYDERTTDANTASTPTSTDTQANAFDIHTPDEELYGLTLLLKVISESHLRGMRKTVVPVPIISYYGSEGKPTTRQVTDGPVELRTAQLNPFAAHRALIRRCLDLGAADVIISPLSPKCVPMLEICAYKAHKDAVRERKALMEISNGRKRSWVGVNDQKPFAYLREAMVSGLMNGICRLTPEENEIASAHVAVSAERQKEVASAIEKWHFCAHSFTDDELLVAAMLMFNHTLSMPELERWRLPTEQLIRFLVVCRTAYNSFVPYHNFRHVVDVLQATFSFLVHIGALPAFSTTPPTMAMEKKSVIAELLSPFEALTLLITAIGHDVGHPGVNNGFLTTLNAPLAQLYNDRSVLESFHCAAYSQILRRYWPAAFEDRKMRNLMISSILATDMGLHFDYMRKLGDLQDMLDHDNSIERWDSRQLEEHKTLACSLLIKCADISNVARHYETAVKWMHILSEEVSRQASMEDELEIKSSLIAAPKKDILSMSNAQLGFMNMFAMPLFQGVVDLIPAMKYTIEQLEHNKNLFEHMVQHETAKSKTDATDVACISSEGAYSPRTRSFGVDHDQDSKDSTSTLHQHDEAGVNDRTNDFTKGLKVETQLASDLSYQTDLPSHNMPPPDAVLQPISHEPKGPFYLNGSSSPFDAVRDLAGSDPFHFHARDDSIADKLIPLGRQRCSETTDGSVTGGCGGDWASQATSAATGKVALSPSTQGTSIVSTESADLTGDVDSMKIYDEGRGAAMPFESGVSTEQWSSTGSLGKADGKRLKKKPSRFRMKDFPFFRRSKGSSPTFSAADTAG